jgi:alpha-amylase
MDHARRVSRAVSFVLFSIAVAYPCAADAGATIHLKGWRYQDITNNMQKIRDAGYTAILLSPHTSTCGGQWSDGYDPYDYTSFNSRFGNESELYWLINTAHYFGVQVYADMVMNQMCAAQYSYPRFGWNDFHHFGSIADWDNRWELENRDLYGLNDLAQESPYVQSELFNFVVKTNNMGFDGYRWDAAKHIPLWFWRDNICPQVNHWGKFHFGEVFHGAPDFLQQYVDAGMAVTDYSLYFALQNAFRYQGNLAVLDGAGFAARDGGKALTFVENHDVPPPTNRLLAYAFLAAYPGPMFFGVSLDDPVMTNLAWINKNLAWGRYIGRYKDASVIIFERDHSLLAAINQTDHWVYRWVSTSWSGAKLHDYAGHTADRWTNPDGTIEVQIPPMSYVMLAP